MALALDEDKRLVGAMLVPTGYLGYRTHIHVHTFMCSTQESVTGLVLVMNLGMGTRAIPYLIRR